MKMPNARQISEEQQDIFEDAPIEGNILVSGPPGTGKTVIAFLRAQLLAKKRKKVVVLMFNRVLRRYTEDVAKDIEGAVESKTMHSWFPEWWRQHYIPNENVKNTIIIENGKVYVNCSFEQKEEIKILGGKWASNKFNPFSKRKGMWYVPIERYNASPECYEKWTGSSYEPIEIKRWQYDWTTMRDKYLDLDDEAMVDWGHLIIDEAQDFEPEFYSFLRMVGRQLDNGGLTILADENQRLEEERHSSLQDIRDALKINNKPELEFRLTKNFRNTIQIAEVARYFFVGLETGIPDLPNRSGNLPSLISCHNTEQQIQSICDYLRLRAALEVGVIVDNEPDRELFVKRLTEQLNNYSIQSYSSNDYKKSETLDFDKKGVVTVLHRKSCKGLEFDAIFVPQLQSFSVEDTDVTTFKMNMYVICSRARSELIFMCNGELSSNAKLFKHFPSLASGLIDYKEQK